MLGQRRARLTAKPCHDVEHTGREPNLQRQFRDADQRQAGILGRLDNAGVAAGQRCRHRTAENLCRIIPRHDMARNAVRVSHDGDGIAVEERDRLAMHLVGGCAVELEIACRRRHVGAGLFQRLATILRLELRQFLVMSHDGIAEFDQQSPTFSGGQPAPGSVFESRARGADSGIDIRLARPRNGGEGQAIRWAKAVESPTIWGFLRNTVDDVAMQFQA
jgi:hypothetical protein